MFKEKFLKYACVDDSIAFESEDGFLVEARIVHDSCTPSPDKHNDGFWPSLNPREAGYIGDDKTSHDLAVAMAQANSVLAAWVNGDWFYCGIVLSVSRVVRIAGRVEQKIVIAPNAASLWGIECNHPESDNAYLNETANDLIPEALEYARAAIQELQPHAKEA